MRPKRRYTSVYSQNKNYRASDQFSLAIVFRWNSRKVDINFSIEIFFSDENSSAIGETDVNGNQALQKRCLFAHIVPITI